MNRLQDRIAILSGSAAGIGKGIATRFVEEGAVVILADRDAERGAATTAALGLDADRFILTDISDEASVEALATQVLDRFGRIDILVQNAGIYPVALVEDTTTEHWDRVHGINLRGTFLATRACVPAMKRQRYGRLVFTSSITGPHVVSHGLSAYAATKAGINGFIRAVALETAAHGITVNGVEPGNIVTEGLETDRSPEFIQSMLQSIPMGRLGKPSDIAGAAAFLASDDAAYITGTTITVDGGQILPESKDFLDPGTWT